MNENIKLTYQNIKENIGSIIDAVIEQAKSMLF